MNGIEIFILHYQSKIRNFSIAILVEETKPVVMAKREFEEKD